MNVKNIFFSLTLVMVIGVSMGLLDKAVADSNFQYKTRGDTVVKNISVMPDAVFKAEDLHKTANKSYKVKGVTYQPNKKVGEFIQSGSASWYGKQFHGRKTSSGEKYNMYEMTAAHKTLPIPSYVKVTNVTNGKSVVVRINDRGPFHSNRIIDLSYAAAKKLDYTQKGVAKVKIEQIVPKKQNRKQEKEFITLKSFDSLALAQEYLEQVSAELKLNHLDRDVQLENINTQYVVKIQVDPSDEDGLRRVHQTLLQNI